MLKRNIRMELPENYYIIQADAVIPLLEEQKRQQEKQIEKIHSVLNIKDLSDSEIKNIKMSITLLEQYYAKEKKKVTEKLEKDITQIVNLWYENDYDFYIEAISQRGKIYTTLKDRKRRGRLKLVCGGAVKQTLGVLFNFAFIRSVGSEFIFLDESFSSLGIEEVNRLPEVFNMLDDIQLICIEHKCELIDSSTAATINITRQTGEPSKVSYIDPNFMLTDSILEIDDISVTEQDINILRDFGFNIEEVKAYRESQGFFNQPTTRLDKEITKQYYEHRNSKKES